MSAKIIQFKTKEQIEHENAGKELLNIIDKLISLELIDKEQAMKLKRKISNLI